MSFSLDPNKVKKLAISKCWSLADLTRKAELSNSTLYKINHGTNKASLRTIGKIARALSVDPSELIKD